MLHRLLALRQGAGRLLQQRINRQVINLIQRIHQTLLDLCQSTADGRDNRIAVKLLYFPARGRLRIEVEIDIQRAGHQVTGFQRAAQSAVDQIVNVGANIRIAAKLINQPLRFNPHFHWNTIVIVQTLLQPRNKERHFADGAQTDTAELHRRARLQAANRVFEEHDVIDMLGKD
ncbi:Uncharacterised protein [Klebsiella pneumoniae]|nr:Uncharacterised protein [Klebsiella pneumoniae]